MHSQARAFYNRVKAQSLSGTSLKDMHRWIEQNTSHPKNPRVNWNFKNHEFQKDIIDCDARDAVIKKVSQVGLSEVIVRTVLALCEIYNNRTAILTLPTSSFAKKFAKTRIDPVIDNSEMLSEDVSKENNSTELKQIASSFLYIAGTFGEKSAISVPGDFLAHDEVDFSNQDVLSNFASRLGHEDTEQGDRKIRRQFSTPTIPKFGISALYEDSSQALYAVKHDRCGQWVMPKFIDDVVLPGFDDSLWAFSREDLTNPKVDPKKAWVKCPGCGKEITVENLATPEKRQWVHAHPQVDQVGFWVQSFDAPTINPPSKTIEQVKEYRNKRDWLNFKVGVEFEDAENSFIESAVDSHRGEWVRPHDRAADGCVFGLDVGKTSHLLIGKKVGRKIHIIHAERVRQTGRDDLKEILKERMEQYGIAKGVLDAAPDFTTAMTLIDAGYDGQIWACQYVRQQPKALTSYTLDEAEQVVKAHRTRTLNEAAKLHNSGRVTWCDSNEIYEIKNNLGNIKKLQRDTAEGEALEYWTKIGPDHYAHALNYLLIAADMAFGDSGKPPLVLATGLSSFQFGSSEQNVRL